jgi:RNA polymerase sigma factor (sigma-70 family)
MAGAQRATTLRHIQRLFAEGSFTGLSDTQLLSRFALRRDEAAFAALVARHGPMVLTVCKGLLRDPSDADDAFQATFLVLARKAGAAWAEGQLGGWLHKVAYRIAVHAGIDATRRRDHERRAAKEPVVEFSHVELDDDLRRVLHDEIARLPAKFRLPIVLCYLEGLTHAQAAAQLQCGEATLRRRLARARERLGLRLAHRGLAPAASTLGASLAREAGATVPAVFELTTVRAVMQVAAGEAIATVVGARVMRLTHGGLTMMTNGSKVIALALLSLAAVATLAGGVGARDDKRVAPTVEGTPSQPKATVVQPLPTPVDTTVKPPTPTTVNRIEAGEKWPMTLSNAFRIAMDNCEGARVLAFNADGIPIGGFEPKPGGVAAKDRVSRSPSLVIGRLDAGASPWSFKSQVMARLRSVEQQYWNLAQSHVQLWASEQAVSLAEEILKREEAELQVGRGTAADVAEAAQRLEQFNLDLVTRTSDVITSERQFRNLLGLPSADARRIIPVSKPTEKLVEPDWETCLNEMKGQHPDIVLNRLAVAELSEPTTFEPGSTIRVLSNVENEARERQRKVREEKLQQVLRQQTHSLARFFLDVDATYKQAATATRLRASGSQRLDAQRAYYKHGRITVDRFLEVVSQYCTAMATESQYKTNYNIALTNLSEAKGTLLADREIVVADIVDGVLSGSMNDKPDRTTEPASVDSRPTSQSAPGRTSTTVATEPSEPMLAVSRPGTSSPVAATPATSVLASVDQKMDPLATAWGNNAKAKSNWPMTLHEALRIAIDKGERHVFAFSEQAVPIAVFAATPADAGSKDWHTRTARLVIGTRKPGASVWRFKTEVMAQCRSVEKQYWNLAQAHEHRWIFEQAVRMAQEILDRERAELAKGRGTVADVTEAAQRLEQFNLDVVTVTSDVIATEQRLRNLLDLPLFDDRRIVPVSNPTEKLVKLDWETCMAEMKEHDPEIVRNTLAIAENWDKDAQQRLNDAVAQKTHSLNRYFVDVNAKYKQLKTASRLRGAAAQRLDAQRAYYAEGRITVDRFMDAISQCSTAMVTEFQYKTLYNIALTNLSEAKGTLLADREIAVIDVVEGVRNGIANDKRDHRLETTSLALSSRADPVSAPALPARAAEPTPSSSTAPQGGDSVPDEVLPAAVASRLDSIVPVPTRSDAVKDDPKSVGKPAPKVWSFSLSIGRDVPFVIKGTISESADNRAEATGH